MRLFKFSGRIAPGSLRFSLKAEAPDGSLLPPNYVSSPWGEVPQYAPEVVGVANGYNPAGDCEGNFMSYRYQPNNNCYAYSCCIAPNTFPQPGRYSGGVQFGGSNPFTAEIVQNNAVKDGLILVGSSLDELKKFAQAPTTNGHYVALLFSAPEQAIGGDKDSDWPGDYHWVRCDDPVNFTSWSQKDGSDQVTNFDFAGQPITNPATANWSVNQGPGTTDPNEYIVTYDFVCYMFVPQGGVNII